MNIVDRRCPSFAKSPFSAKVSGVRRARGFSLIEVMIVVAIVGLLATIAYPSYRSYVLKTHRSDGRNSLVDLANDMERYYFLNNRYPDDLKTFRPNQQVSDEGYYRLGIDTTTDRDFLLSATPIGSQADDTACGVLRINSEGTKSAAGSADTSQCW